MVFPLITQTVIITQILTTGNGRSFSQAGCPSVT